MAAPAFLVDTNVLSELARPRANDRVVAWARTVVKVSLSVITLEEIQFGLMWKPSARVQAWFNTFLEEHCELEAVTAEIARAAPRSLSLDDLSDRKAMDWLGGRPSTHLIGTSNPGGGPHVGHTRWAT